MSVMNKLLPRKSFWLKPVPVRSLWAKCTNPSVKLNLKNLQACVGSTRKQAKTLQNSNIKLTSIFSWHGISWQTANNYYLIITPGAECSRFPVIVLLRSFQFRHSTFSSLFWYIYYIYMIYTEPTYTEWDVNVANSSAILASPQYKDWGVLYAEAMIKVKTIKEVSLNYRGN